MEHCNVTSAEYVETLVLTANNDSYSVSPYSQYYCEVTSYISFARYYLRIKYYESINHSQNQKFGAINVHYIRNAIVLPFAIKCL